MLTTFRHIHILMYIVKCACCYEFENRVRSEHTLNRMTFSGEFYHALILIQLSHQNGNANVKDRTDTGPINCTFWRKKIQWLRHSEVK